MPKLYTTRNDCRLCGSNRLDLVVPLAPMPIATPTFRVPGVGLDSEAYKKAVPLELFLCAECGLLQLLHIVDPKFLYQNYVYRTSTSLGLGEHFNQSADKVINYTRVASGALIVEIGSNDGTQLRAYKARGMKVLGVDPALAIAEAATRAGVETLGAFFTMELAGRIRGRHGPAAIIVANNLFANVDDLNGMTAGIRGVLAPDGVFVFQTQYGADVIQRLLVDTIYHEHLSYFYITPLQRFFAKYRLEIFDVQRIWTKGGSIEVYVQHAGGPRKILPIVGKMMDEERRLWLLDPTGYENFVARLQGIRKQLGEIVASARTRNQKIAGYGASVGTTTLIPQFGLGQELQMIFDDDPDKVGFLSGPDYKLRVLPSTDVLKENPAVIVIFAWRYIDPIMEKHAEWRRRGGKFVVPLPDVVVK